MLQVIPPSCQTSMLFSFLVTGLRSNLIYIISIFKASFALPWEPEIFSRVRRGALSVAGRLVFGRAKTRAAKLWPPGYFRASSLNNGNACINARLKGLSI